jgi:hypothetical protein
VIRILREGRRPLLTLITGTLVVVHGLVHLLYSGQSLEAVRASTWNGVAFLYILCGSRVHSDGALVSVYPRATCENRGRNRACPSSFTEGTNMQTYQEVVEPTPMQTYQEVVEPTPMNASFGGSVRQQRVGGLAALYLAAAYVAAMPYFLVFVKSKSVVDPPTRWPCSWATTTACRPCI